MASPTLLNGYETKGKYYRFVPGQDGDLALKPVKVPMHVKKAREEARRQEVISQSAKRNLERSSSMNVGYVVFMAIGIIVCCVVCYFYISLISESTNLLQNVENLKNQIEQVQSDNNEVQKRIDTAMTITEIKDRAENSLNMSSAESDQIEYYSVSGGDYMLQYDDVD